MDEYIENNKLPKAIEQKYEWSCKICNIKEALNYLLKINISEDDLLSKIKYVDAGEVFFAKIKNDCPSLKVIATKWPMKNRLEFMGLNKAVRSFCKNKAIFAERHHLHTFLEEKKKITVHHMTPDFEFEHAIRKSSNNALEYWIAKELIKNDAILSADGSREEVNKIDAGVSHAFMIKGMGQKNGRAFAKVLDSNYNRRDLAPEYVVPLEKLRVDMMFYRLS